MEIFNVLSSDEKLKEFLEEGLELAKLFSKTADEQCAKKASMYFAIVYLGTTLSKEDPELWGQCRLIQDELRKRQML